MKENYHTTANIILIKKDNPCACISYTCINLFALTLIDVDKV